MNSIKVLDKNLIEKNLIRRAGEKKFGEDVFFLKKGDRLEELLEKSNARFVLFGIPEDVGIYANYGLRGASKTWNYSLEKLLNLQSNRFTHPNKTLIIGTIDCDDEMRIIHSQKSNPNQSAIKKARKQVEKIDSKVAHLVYCIVKSGKIPIAIGGGHNNAYGMIKGAAMAFNSPINAVNFDAHSDFRRAEGRHSGNGFSYAYAEGFLKRYFAFGIHEAYTPDQIFSKMRKLKDVDYCSYENLKIRRTTRFKRELEKALAHISGQAFGVEIDVDAIENIPSSAQTPSGFSVDQARRFVTYFGVHKKSTYLHICEAAPSKKQGAHVGKLISYLIADFISANLRS